MTLPTTGAVDTCPTGANLSLLVVGPSSASATVALPIPTFDGQAVTARSVTVPTGQTWLIPLPSSVYGPGPITLTWSGTLTASAEAVVATAG
jgi:spore germination protein YaaH